MILFEEKYKAVMNSVEPDPALLDKILGSAGREEKTVKKKHIFRYTMIPAAACLAVFFLAIMWNKIYLRYDAEGGITAYNTQSLKSDETAADTGGTTGSPESDSDAVNETAEVSKKNDTRGLSLPAKYSETSRREDKTSLVISYESEDGGSITAVITEGDEQRAEAETEEKATVLLSKQTDENALEREFEKDGKKYRITAKNISEAEIDEIIGNNKR